MRDFSLAVLGRAVYDVTFSEMTKPFAHAMAVGHAAHGAELALKARIAEEHPLLIFEGLPKPTTTQGELSVAELFEHGRTIRFDELPEVLWATTGIRMQRVDHFQRFGKLRNTIIHFAIPAIELECETLHFVFDVMEPLVQDFWGLSVLDQAEEWDEVVVADGYLEEQLTQCGVVVTDQLRKAIDRIKGS